MEKKISPSYIQDVVPIIVSSNDFPDIHQKKYFARKDLSVAAFIFILRKKLTIAPEAAIYLSANGSMITSGDLLITVFERYKSPAGILYVDCHVENVFGCP